MKNKYYDEAGDLIRSLEFCTSEFSHEVYECDNTVQPFIYNEIKSDRDLIHLFRAKLLEAKLTD